MKSNKLKALFLAVVMMISLLPLSALADEVILDETEETSKQVESIVGKDLLEELSENAEKTGEYDYQALFDAIGDEDLDPTEKVTVDSGSTTGFVLKDNTTYTFTKSMSFTNTGAGNNGMEVEPGAKVFLYIPRGVTIRVRGTNAEGTKGAGAGIRVPKDSTLIIKGIGAIQVYGGSAANGEDGYKGEDAWITFNDDGHMRAGNGGQGGAGGGGAAAAIGGNGGDGGLGGEGGIFGGKELYDGKHTVHCSWDDADCNGGAGSSGYSGSDGEECGKIIIMDTVIVDCTAGYEGKDGATGPKGNSTTDSGSGWGHYYSAGQSGGGGGGQGGRAPFYGIGGGGAGGAGGGGGGAGSTRVAEKTWGNPAGGNGGTGTSKGAEEGVSNGSQKGGNGGKAGSIASCGASGKVYINRGTTVTGRPCYYYDANLVQSTNLIMSAGECPLIFGDITRINGYKGSYAEGLALALYELKGHNAYHGYYVKDAPSDATFTSDFCNGAYKYYVKESGHDNWYKEFVDTCGGYFFNVVDQMGECLKSDFKREYNNDDDDSNPWYFIEWIYGKLVGENKNRFIFDNEMKSILHEIMYYEHYGEPEGGKRGAPGYTKSNRTAGTHSTKDGALKVIHLSYIICYEENTNRNVSMYYNTARDYTAFNWHYYYRFSSELIVLHDKIGICADNWMSYLPDDMPICDVNIPGAHDAGTADMDLFPSFLSAQDAQIDEQLEMGVRFLDLRFDPKEVDGKKKAVIYHGGIKACYKGEPLTYDQIIKWCRDFLAQERSKNEFIVFMYNAEGDRNDEWKKLMDDMMAKYANPKNSIIWNPEGNVPTVGECRGKIIFMDAHDICKWQDEWYVICKTKKKLLKEYFGYNYPQRTGVTQKIKTTGEGKDLPYPRLNFASTCKTIVFIPEPIDCGYDVNEWICEEYDFKEGYSYGWIPLNACDLVTCEKIYLSNKGSRAEIYGQDLDGDGNKDIKYDVVGSMFSPVNYILIGAFALLVVAGIAVVIVVRKKKKSKKANAVEENN